MVRKPIDMKSRRRTVHYCHQCQKSTAHSPTDGQTVCNECRTEHRELFRVKPKEGDSVPILLSGGPEPRLWGRKKVYGRRRVGLVAVKKDFEQVKVRSFGGFAWLNLTESGTL